MPSPQTDEIQHLNRQASLHSYKHEPAESVLTPAGPNKRGSPLLQTLIFPVDLLPDSNNPPFLEPSVILEYCINLRNIG